MAAVNLHRQKRFQPTRPLRGATLPRGQRLPGVEISTHAPLAGRDEFLTHFTPEFFISTHAPLAGRDVLPLKSMRVGEISTHAPLAGRDTPDLKDYPEALVFQPTRPLRGATDFFKANEAEMLISTHAPLAGRDGVHRRVYGVLEGISTHAPLAGRDTSGRVPGDCSRYFNPRAPCGARLSSSASAPKMSNFNPRAPCGARLRENGATPEQRHFNPRAPCGARPRSSSTSSFNA